MEHYDWNEYHADLMARRQAEAQKQAGQQDAGAAQQSTAPQQAAEAQPAPQQAAGTQPAPQQAAGAHQPAASAQPSTTAEPAPEPSPSPIETEPQDEPPTSWDYNSSPSFQHPAQGATYQDTAYQGAASQSSKKKGNRTRTILIVVIVVAVVAVIAVIAVFALGNGSSSSSGTESAEASSVTSDSLQGMVDSLDWMAPMAATTDDYSYDDEDEEEDSSTYDYDEEEDTSSSSYDSIDEFLESYGTFEEVTVTGTGSDVFDLPVDDGPMLISIEFEGDDEDSYLDVCTLDADGDIVEIYASITGTTYSGVWTNAVYESYEEYTTTQVQVWANGDWTITFSPLNTMEALENGKTYTSSGVYYIDDEDLESLEIVYEITDPDDSGGCNFYFDIVSADDFDYVSIYEESLQTTLEWDGSQPTFVAIDTEGGEWSISW